MNIVKMNSKNTSKILTLATTLFMSCCQQLAAQQVGLWYDTELQILPSGKSNHVNLLYLSADYACNEHIRLSGATISIAKTRDESLVDDLQTFSNIEADNVPLTLALACVGWMPSERHSFYFGIRNVNEDYFISPVTSLFTNSSCGFFPTIGCNLPIANYPLASVGVHYAYSAPWGNLQASVYNGRGYQDFGGRENLWRVAPASDGVFLMAQADMTHGGQSYYLGASHHSGIRQSSASGAERLASSQSVLWAYTEQQLTPRVALIASLSHAFGRDCLCTDFVGLGAQYQRGRTTLGLFTDYARFADDKEWATELIVSHDVLPGVSLQAACHLIAHDGFHPVGLLRVSVRLPHDKW